MALKLILKDRGHLEKKRLNNVSEVRSFLGFCSYYGRFVPQFAPLPGFDFNDWENSKFELTYTQKKIGKA